MPAITAALGAVIGTVLIGIVVLILAFLMMGILAPLGGFIESRSAAHRALVRSRPARRSHTGRVALHH